MLKRLLSPVVCFVLLGLAVNPMVPSTFKDKRDGKTYKLVEVEDKVWMAENLRFKSPRATVKTRKKQGDSLVFYSLLERTQVCPAPFHLLRKSELDEALELFYAFDESRVDTLSSSDPLLFAYHNTGKKFTANRGVFFKRTGWVQGGKYRKNKTLHLWLDYHNDARFHMHLGDSSAYVHAHDHNVIDEERKQRKFGVRCVCEREALLKWLE